MVWTCTLDQGHRNKKHHIEGRTFQKVRISVTGDLTTLEAIYSAYLYIDSLGKITTKVCKKYKQYHPRPANVYKNLSFGPLHFFHFFASFRSLTAKGGVTMTPTLVGTFLPTSLDQEFIVLNLKNIEKRGCLHWKYFINIITIENRREHRLDRTQVVSLQCLFHTNSGCRKISITALSYIKKI